MVNVENVLKVADAIEKHTVKSLGFNMGDFIRRDGAARDMSGHNCRTTGCLAGWAVTVDDGAVPKKWSEEKYDQASDFLGLSFDQSQALFIPDALWEGKPLSQERAVAVLRRLAATGEVDWSAGAP